MFERSQIAPSHQNEASEVGHSDVRALARSKNHGLRSEVGTGRVKETARYTVLLGPRSY